MAMSTSAILRDEFLDLIEEQIQSGTPPEPRRTFNRLLRQGFTGGEAIRYIASIFAIELYEVLDSPHAFDEQRFAANLRQLPSLPWEYLKVSSQPFGDEHQCVGH
jgi:hypothetical protein